MVVVYAYTRFVVDHIRNLNNRSKLASQLVFETPWLSVALDKALEEHWPLGNVVGQLMVIKKCLGQEEERIQDLDTFIGWLNNWRSSIE